MRDELLRDESKAKNDFQKQKLDEINAKMAQLELTRQQKDEQTKQQELQDQQRRDAAQAMQNQEKKSFLNNIKSFDVEDI